MVVRQSVRLAALAAVALVAGHARAAPAIELLSPARDGLVSPTPAIAVEVSASGLRSVSVSVPGRVVSAVRSGDRFVAWEVPLRVGENRLTIRATTEGGRASASSVTVVSAQRSETLALAATPAFVEGGRGVAHLRLRTSLDSARLGDLLVDGDGDGAIDHRGPYEASVPVTYDSAGHYAARVAVQDAETGLLLCTRSSEASRVRVVPASERVADAGFAGIGPDVRDLEYDPYSRRVYTLSSEDKRVRSYQFDGSLAEEIVLPDVHDPRGIGLDRHGNLYVADAGAHRILKLVAADGWAPDKQLGSGRGTFGLRGSEVGMLQAPVDVCVEPSGDEPRIIVADTGNDRVQLFTARGVCDRVIDGATTPEGRLGAPQSVAVTRLGAIIVADRGNSLIRRFHVSGRQELAFGGPGAELGRFQRLAKISFDQRTQGFVVADPGNLRVHLFDRDGALRRVHTVASPGAEAGALDHAPTISRWILARSGSPALDVYRVHQDPPGLGPLDAARSFLEALRSGDTRAARAAMLPRRQAHLIRDLAVPARRERLEAIAAAVDTLTLVRVPASDSAVARVRPERDSAENEVEVHLLRSRTTGLWQVLEY